MIHEASLVTGLIAFSPSPYCFPVPLARLLSSWWAPAPLAFLSFCLSSSWRVLPTVFSLWTFPLLYGRLDQSCRQGRVPFFIWSRWWSLAVRSTLILNWIPASYITLIPDRFFFLVFSLGEECLLLLLLLISSSGYYRLCISGPVQVILYFLTSVFQMLKLLKFFGSQKSNSGFPDVREKVKFYLMLARP